MLTIPESKGIMWKPEGIIGASSEKKRHQWEQR
jgi:hypothetical protein